MSNAPGGKSAVNGGREAVSITEDLTRHYLATLAQWTGGLSPHAFGGAWLDWLSHLSTSPGRQGALVEDAVRKAIALWQFSALAASGAKAAPEADGTPYARRFSDPDWQVYPWNVLAQSFLSMASWWRNAVQGVPGMEPDAANIVGFTARESLELLAPDNYLPTNPQLIEQTVKEQGQNLLRGLAHWADDIHRTLEGHGPVGVEEYAVGEKVAASPGKVILRNRLIELIQYEPQTESVFAEPILIVPAWIMKYYILDLSARNSLVRYLTGLGHTVFMISWKNPVTEDRELSMDDYVELGFNAALDAVNTVVPGRKVHATGSCIGGTLLSIAAALLGGRKDDRLASVTLFAAQTDFSEPGELSLFISPAQLAMLEAVMWKDGVLDSRKMGAAFQLLRTYDLMWAPAIGTYLRGERAGLNDLMAWNADGTRMAYRMHTDYLRQLYLNNDLATGRYTACCERVNLGNLRIPMFVVGTETDHVAPWQSVYKVEQLARSPDYTFLLTSGGHNAGIISGPQHPKRRHRIHTTRAGEHSLSADEFMANAELRQGSWWPTWAEWLAARSSPEKVAPPAMGAAEQGLAPLDDAPGKYVLAR
ncbi:MAG TPA: alpha/beta fold hydrolase [Steroidobacteraceae bacterium]|nr:alpha/beta fold hydrolase [Steroidobacteraceae bacterium]